MQKKEYGTQCSNRNYLKWGIERETGEKNVLWDNKRSIFSLTYNCESQGEYITKISEDTSVAEHFPNLMQTINPGVQEVQPQQNKQRKPHKGTSESNCGKLVMNRKL